MAKGYSISIASETRDFQTGVKRGIIDPLDDAAELLADIGRNGGRDIEQVERAMRDAQKETGDTEDAVRKLQAQIRDTGGRARGDLAQPMKKAADETSEAFEQVKDDGFSNAKEVAASFDGSAQSIAEGFQGAAAEAFSGFGPAGALAGLAAAAGLGVIIQEFEKIGEEQEASAERASEWADKFIEAGSRIIGASQIVAGVQAIATDPEQYKQASENAKNWGVDVSTAMRAMAGDATALDIVQGEVAKRAEEYGQIIADSATGAATSYGAYDALTESQQRLVTEFTNGRKALNDLNGEMDAGAERAGNVSDALRDLVDSAADATVKVDDVGNKLYELPDGTEVLIDAKTGRATQNIADFKGDLDAIPANKAVTVNGTVELDASPAERALERITTRRPRVYIEGRMVDRYGREIT